MNEYRCGCLICQSEDRPELQFSAAGTSPSTSWTSSIVLDSGNASIDALNSGYKWGSLVGSGTALSYSFPWENGASASFSGYNGRPYSNDGEWTAQYRTGLNSTQQNAAVQALQAWSNVANITFTRVQDSATTVGDIRFAFSSAESLSKSWGYARYPNSYWPSAGDIWIKYDLADDTDWSKGSHNYLSLIHEIGHALGLSHPNDNPNTLSEKYTVMSYVDSPNSVWFKDLGDGYTWYNIHPDTPMLYDILAIQYIYGANTSYRNGNDTYTFDPLLPFFRTIWDGGGTDTIDCSNLTKNQIIDLREGLFSSIKTVDSMADPLPGQWKRSPPSDLYNGTNNLAIAYGAVIENATGGSGSDQITGNLSNNTLRGSGGNDTIYGGAGNDVLEGGSGSDTLYGESGNDTFDWDVSSRAGADSFYGGAGNDVYVLTDGDRVFEFLDQGIDTVWVDFSYSIASDCHIENLYGYGTTRLSLTGSSRNERFQGSSSGDTIDGGDGTDTAVYALARSSYSVTRTTLGYQVSSSSETDQLSNIEFIEFAGVSYAIASLIDTTPPTIAITSNTASLSAGQAALLTFTLSETSTNFTASDVAVSGGTLSNFSGSGTSYTATFTPTANSTTAGVVSVASGAFTDAAGNANADGSDANNRVSMTVNTVQTTPVTGTAANNSFTSSSANEAFDGGAGLDTVVFSGLRSQYSLSAQSAGGFRVTDSVASRNGTDTVSAVERLQFSDISLALDLDGNAGKVAKILGAVFGKLSVNNKQYVGIGLNLLDGGMSYESLAALAVSAADKTSSTDVCTLLWTNVFNKAPTASDIAPFKAMLDSGQMSIGSFAALAADTSFNTTNIDLVGLSRTGIEYV